MLGQKSFQVREEIAGGKNENTAVPVIIPRFKVLAGPRNVRLFRESSRLINAFLYLIGEFCQFAPAYISESGFGPGWLDAEGYQPSFGCGRHPVFTTAINCSLSRM